MHTVLTVLNVDRDALDNSANLLDSILNTIGVLRLEVSDSLLDVGDESLTLLDAGHNV